MKSTIKNTVLAVLFAAVLSGVTACEDPVLSGDVFTMSIASVNGGMGVVSGEPLYITLNVNQEFAVVSYDIPVLNTSTQSYLDAIGNVISVDRKAYEERGKTGSEHVTYKPEAGNKYTFSFDNGDLVYVDRYQYQSGELLSLEIEVQSMVTGTKIKSKINFEAFYDAEMSVKILNPHSDVTTSAAKHKIDGKQVPLYMPEDMFTLRVSGTVGDRFRFINGTTGVSELDDADAGKLIHSSSSEYVIEKVGYVDIPVGMLTIDELCFGDDNCRKAKFTVENLTSGRKYDYVLPFYTAPSFEPEVQIVNGVVQGGAPLRLTMKYPFSVSSYSEFSEASPTVAVTGMKILDWVHNYFYDDSNSGNDKNVSELFGSSYSGFSISHTQQTGVFGDENLEAIAVVSPSDVITLTSVDNVTVEYERDACVMEVVVKDDVYTGQSRIVRCGFKALRPENQKDFTLRSEPGTYVKVPVYVADTDKNLSMITVSSVSDGITLTLAAEDKTGSREFGYVWDRNPGISLDGSYEDSGFVTVDAGSYSKVLTFVPNKAYVPATDSADGYYTLTFFTCKDKEVPALKGDGTYEVSKTLKVKVIPTVELCVEAVVGYKWLDGTSKVHSQGHAYSRFRTTDGTSSSKKSINDLTKDDPNLLASEWYGWPEQIYVIAKCRNNYDYSYSVFDVGNITVPVRLITEHDYTPTVSAFYYGVPNETYGNKTGNNHIYLKNSFEESWPATSLPENYYEESVKITSTGTRYSLPARYLKCLQDWDYMSVLAWQSNDTHFRFAAYDHYKASCSWPQVSLGFPQYMKNISGNWDSDLYDVTKVYIASFKYDIQNVWWEGSYYSE